MLDWVKSHVTLKMVAITIAVIAVFATAAFGIALASFLNTRDNNRSKQTDFNSRLCEVIPDAFGDSARVLVAASVSAQRKAGVPEAQIQDTIEAGDKFAKDVTAKVLERLQPCPTP